MSPSSKHQLHVYLFGAFRIEDKAQLIHLPTRKVESLLAYLILHPGPHPREKLAALFWGDSSDVSARGSLRKALALLRKYINEGIVLSDRENVQLNSNFPLWVDVFEFQQKSEKFLADPSKYSNPNQWDCYQDVLLHDNYDDWVLPLREQYRSLYLDVLLRAVEHCRAESEYKLAIEHAQKVLGIDQTIERAHQHLMFCYLTLGDRIKALQQYEACERILQDELAVEPTRETQALYRWIEQSGSEIPSLAPRLTNLPIPISSFVGRHKELAKVKQLLSNARLVTLTGAGGSGKTRLAIHAATDLLDSFKDGVWWVELAPLTDPLLVPSAVAKALGVDGRSDQPLMEILKMFLHNRKVLLVLDNCEHLIDACAQLTETLLTSCADLKILATSRETLRLTGEHVWQVPGLSLPDVLDITLINLLMQFEGIRLFVERSNAINPDFTPSDENATAIAQICQRLDGIPLAIELAAARIKTMSIEEILDGLIDRFQLLTAQNRTAQTRHQTLRATVDWSYDLLTEDERLLFCRLSVFSGGWTLDAAELVCSGDGIEEKNISYLLARLVDKSLITVGTDGQRYGMLETMRQYGDEKLILAGEQDRIFQQYLSYYVKMAEVGDEKIRGPEQLEWFNWFEAERDNLATAMDKSLDSPDLIEEGCELVCSMCWYWKTAGNYNIMEHWLRAAYSQTNDLNKLSTMAKVLFCVGFYSVAGLDWLKPAEAYSTIEESLAIWHELGPEFAIEYAQCLLVLGYIQKRSSDDDKGYDLINESIVIFDERQCSWWKAFALNLLGWELVEDMKDIQFALKVLDEESALWMEIGDQCASAVVFWDLGSLAFERGDLVEANGHFQEALKRHRNFGAKSYILQSLVHLGDIARRMKQYDLAERYYQESIPLAQDTTWYSWLSQIYRGLGYVTLTNGDSLQADKYFRQALVVSQELNMKFGMVLFLVGYASLAAFRGELGFATRLFGSFYAQYECLESVLKTTRRRICIIDQVEAEKYIDHCRSQMEEPAFEKAWNEGRSLSLEAAIREIENISG